MTIIQAVMTGAEICLLADCRLSSVDAYGNPIEYQPGAILARDVCQKLFVADGRAVIGFAGDLCLARDLIRGVLNRIRNDSGGAAGWLRSDDAIRAFLRDGVNLHVQGRPTHARCRHARVDLLIAWIDHEQSMFGRPRGEEEEFYPWMGTISIELPTLGIRRRPMGVQVIGSGEVIRDALMNGPWIDISWFNRGEDEGPIGRALYAASETTRLLRQVDAATVGGLFQVAVLSPRGARLIPHFQFIPMHEPGWGTYVAMRIEGGMWLQEHRPTGTIIRVEAPFDIQLRGPRWQAPQLFDSRADMTIQSPGAIQPSTSWVLEFCPYDPDSVYDDIRRSWGDAPLTPLSWAEGPPPRR
jgi:hypothetical protein